MSFRRRFEQALRQLANRSRNRVNNYFCEILRNLRVAIAPGRLVTCTSEGDTVASGESLSMI